MSGSHHIDPEDSGPRYERPPQEVVEDIRRHLGEHGHELNLRRDVAWPGNKAKNAVIALELANFAGPARYWCHHCGPGRVFIVGEPEWGPERVSYLRRIQPEVEPWLRGLPEERWIETLKLLETGELQRRAIDAALARERQKTRRPGDPASVKRRTGCQRWMLERYAEVGNRDAVWDELETIIASDRERWYEISGGYRPITRWTIEDYWKKLPLEDRDAARARYDARPEPERRSAEKQRRKQKPTP